MRAIADEDDVTSGGERRLRQFLLWAGIVALLAILPFMSGFSAR